MRRWIKEDVVAFINLTPLIDVVFVVLIAFIIIAPLLEIDRVSLAPSLKSSVKNMEKDNINIYVKEDESIWIGKKNISFNNLLVILKKLKERYPLKKLQLYHDKKASFGLYQKIKKVAEISGYESIDVVLKKDEIF